MFFKERRALSNNKSYQDYEDTKIQLDLIDKFINPSFENPINQQPSQKVEQDKNKIDKSFQIPKVVVFPEDKLNEEVAQMQQALDQQSQTLKLLLKEQQEINKNQALKQKLDYLKTQVQNLHLKLPKLPQYDQLYEIKHEINSLRYSFFQNSPRKPFVQPLRSSINSCPNLFPSLPQRGYHPLQHLMNPYQNPYNPHSHRVKSYTKDKYTNLKGKNKKNQNKTQNSVSQITDSERSSSQSIPYVSKRVNQKPKQKIFMKEPECQEQKKVENLN